MPPQEEQFVIVPQFYWKLTISGKCIFPGCRSNKIFLHAPRSGFIAFLLSVRKEMSSCLAADGTSAWKLPQNLAAVPAAAKQNTALFT